MSGLDRWKRIEELQAELILGQQTIKDAIWNALSAQLACYTRLSAAIQELDQLLDGLNPTPAEEER